MSAGRRSWRPRRGRARSGSASGRAPLAAAAAAPLRVGRAAQGPALGVAGAASASRRRRSASRRRMPASGDPCGYSVAVLPASWLWSRSVARWTPTTQRFTSTAQLTGRPCTAASDDQQLKTSQPSHVRTTGPMLLAGCFLLSCFSNHDPITDQQRVAFLCDLAHSSRAAFVCICTHEPLSCRFMVETLTAEFFQPCKPRFGQVQPL